MLSGPLYQCSSKSEQEPHHQVLFKAIFGALTLNSDSLCNANDNKFLNKKKNHFFDIAR